MQEQEQGYKEFVVWGIPPNETEETLLYTLAKTLQEAKGIVELLTEKHGVTEAHIQIINFDNDLLELWKSPDLLAK
jgi:hypothetical protein